jgi:hypothetical protein
MADLLGSDFSLAEAHKLYACHDLLLAHKDALFSHLTQRLATDAAPRRSQYPERPVGIIQRLH